MTIEGQIFDKVIENLQDISISNGYSFDIGDHVYEWHDSPFDENVPFALNVKDPLNEVTDEGNHQITFEISLAMQGNTSPADIRQKKQDVITAFSLIRNEDYVESAQFNSTQMTVEKEGKRVTEVVFDFSVFYECEEWII